MSEFDPPTEPHSPEAHLRARFKLERIIFGSCALVLATFFSLGLSAFLQMQEEIREAEQRAETAAALATDRATTATRLDYDLQSALNDGERLRHTLALEKCRLAAIDIVSGDHARARASLAEAISLGAPPWATLLQYRLNTEPVRFTGSRHSNASVVAGAVSDDRRRLAVLRDLGAEGGLIEIHDARTGSLLAATSLPVAEADSYLAMNHTGDRLVIMAGGRVFQGVAGESPAPLAEIADARMLAADRDLTNLLIGHDHGLTLLSNGATRTSLPRPEGKLLAIGLASGVPHVIAGTRLLRWADGEDGRWQTLLEFGREPSFAALADTPGALRAGVLVERDVVEVVMAQAADPVVSRRPLPDGPWSRLLFLDDAGILCLGYGSAALRLKTDGRDVFSLGGYNVSFAALGAGGLVFGNDRGQVSVRVLEDEYRFGTSLLFPPPEHEIRLQAAGIVITSPTGGSHVFVRDRWISAGKRSNVVATGNGFAGSDGETIALPWGATTTVSRDGILTAGFSDGTLLLRKPPSEFVFLGSDQRRQQVTPTSLTPDAVATSARGRAAALRYRNTIYFTDLDHAPHTRVLAETDGVQPDLIALSASGSRLALGIGHTIRVIPTGGGSESILRTAKRPVALALLFEGTIVASVEEGALAFYEVASGRELWRDEGKVKDIVGAGEFKLYVHEDGRLRLLRLRG